jgi:hypothetical protein
VLAIIVGGALLAAAPFSLQWSHYPRVAYLPIDAIGPDDSYT